MYRTLEGRVASKCVQNWLAAPQAPPIGRQQLRREALQFLRSHNNGALFTAHPEPSFERLPDDRKFLAKTRNNAFISANDSL